MTDTPNLKHPEVDFDGDNKSQVEKTKRAIMLDGTVKITKKRRMKNMINGSSSKSAGTMGLDLETIDEGSFILVKFAGKKSI